MAILKAVPFVNFKGKIVITFAEHFLDRPKHDSKF